MVSLPTRRSVLAGAAAGFGGLLTHTGIGAQSAPAYEAVKSVEDGATITGLLKYAGPPVELEQVTVAKDSAICGTDDRARQAVRVAAGGELADCVIQVKGVKQGKAWSPLQDEAKVFQFNCSFQPYVQVVRKGAMLHVINLDTILHNIHAYEIVGRARRTLFNFSQPKAGEEDRVPMKLRRGNLVSLDCNVHNWMAGWIYTAETPYLTVTEEDGTFEIADVPAGTYEFSIWHPVLGEKSGQLKVEPGGDLDLNLVWS